MKTSEFPMVVKGENCIVTIYRRDNKGYDEYRLAYYQEGKRRMESSSDFLSIKSRADEVVEDLDAGQPVEDTGAMKIAQRNDYNRAIEYIKPTGQHLDVAAKTYAHAYQLVGDHILIACQEYKRRKLDKIQPRLVSDAVKEMIAEKERQKRSGRHVETLRSHLGKFGSQVLMMIASVTAEDINGFLDRLKKKNKQDVSVRTRDNFADSIVTLFEWAKLKQYVPSDYDETNRITRLDNDEDGTIEIYTPKELESLLLKADEKLVPFLAIGGFAGLRSSEIMRLNWEDVRMENGEPCIVVQKGKVKKAGKSRRVVPMGDNLKAWLKPYSKNKGPVFPYSKTYVYELLEALAPKAEVKWKSNALRHSYISYRVMKIKNVPQVALECGNSPQMIDSNYRELVSDADAVKWFSLMPAGQ